MSDPHRPKFIIALCEAATIKPSTPHHHIPHSSLLSHYETHNMFSVLNTHQTSNFMIRHSHFTSLDGSGISTMHISSFYIGK